jgi:GTP pyrophosphokinase
MGRSAAKLKSSAVAARPAPAGAPSVVLAPEPAEPGSLEALLEHVRSVSGDDASRRVADAYALAESAHRGQRRASGEPYITHPLAVAHILREMGLDPAALAAALLHDVLEDTPLTESELESQFGVEVARLVSGATKISAIEAHEKQGLKLGALQHGPSEESENLRRMFLAAVDDMRVILIKMADRLHNMRTLGSLGEERRRRLATETLEIYAPLANRLGIWQLKSEFEDLALSELEPETYTRIETELAERRTQHEVYLADVIQRLHAALAEAGIRARITGRTKHIYSIYRKMEQKDLTSDQVFDVLAVRVVVDELNQCYVALGIVHAMWGPITGGFDDYIAKAKNNLYQSLHTSVLGPGKRPLEVQIRTEEMHEVAEYGVAAHWMYKETGPRSREIEEKIGALRRLLKSHSDEAVDADAFVEGLKTDVFRDQVYVFTPAGKVIELPAGSTPVDFAYQIHTEVGDRCRGAIVDGRMVSLDTALETGQTVKIVTAKGAGGPSRDWLNPTLGYVASSHARDKIRQHFRRQAKQQAIREGREVVDRQLRKVGLTRLSYDEVAAQFGYGRVQDFLAAVGRHDIPTEAIGAQLLEAEAATTGQPDARRPSGAEAPVVTVPTPTPAGITMLGTDGVFTRIARCCSPVPGEDIMGYVTRGRGVTLHREDCQNIAHRVDKEPERFIRVNWRREAAEAYPVQLRIFAYDRPGLVRDISDVIARRGVNMSSVSAVAAGDGTAVVTAIVHVPSFTELGRLIDKLGTIDNVFDVVRHTG